MSWSPLGGRLLGVGLPGRESRREHSTFGKVEVDWYVGGVLWLERETYRRCISRTLLYTKLSLSFSTTLDVHM